jgi:cell division protein FtsN
VAAARRPRASSGGKRAARLPGWAILLLGLTLGVAVVLITQLLIPRAGSSDGLAGLFKAKQPAPAAPAKRTEPAAPKPKLDFYTVLPEIETVLPDRGRTKIVKATPPEEGVGYVLQAGSFASYEDADQLKAKLALQGLQAHIQKVSIEGKGDLHRVRLGPYENLHDLDNASRQLTKMGIKPMRLKVKKGAG